jgi:uncharacterized protein YndB with AHSA1/START domain
VPLTDVAPLEAAAEIAAPPAVVWALVSDLRNMPRWSPQTAKSFLRGRNGPGARLVNVNRSGLLVWPTTSKVVRFEEGTEIAWRVAENRTIWSLRLEPSAGGGTRLVQRREAPDGISDVSVGLTKVAFGGVERFTETLQAGMVGTLERIKAEAEREAGRQNR